jgi:hypothetical protein
MTRMNTDLDVLADNIASATDFAAFLVRFAKEVKRSPGEWSNIYLSTFLDAMANWISSSLECPDSAGYRLLQEDLTWKSLAGIILAAA